MALTVYLGIDVGSVTTKVALVDEKGKFIDSYMLRTAGKPVMAVQTGLRELFKKATTHSARPNSSQPNPLHTDKQIDLQVLDAANLFRLQHAKLPACAS